MRRKIIKFYDKHQKYYELTNFYYRPFTMLLKNRYLRFPTAEHAYQFSKYLDNPNYLHIYRQIVSNRSPRHAFNYARKHPYNYRKFDQIRVKMMKEVLIAKFGSSRRLRNILLKTGRARLVEDSPTDAFWGIGPNKKGLNMLGHLLERVRSYYR